MVRRISLILISLVGCAFLTVAYLIVSGVYGMTKGEALIHASEIGDVAQIRVLVKSGVQVDYDFEGSTPLSFAATNGHVAAVKCLLELGADPNRIQFGGERIEEAVRNDEIKGLLRSHKSQ